MWAEDRAKERENRYKIIVIVIIIISHLLSGHILISKFIQYFGADTNTNIQVYLKNIVDLIPDHYNKSNIAKKKEVT